MITSAPRGDAGGVNVSGLHTAVTIINQEPANDRLTLNGLAGADHVDAMDLQADGIALTMNGGIGDDVLLGSQGADLVIGGTGNDQALLGGGDDTFVWNPGDNSDTVEGQGGFDHLLFNGANISEHIDISANGGRVRFFRDVANITMDLNGVEGIDFKALGGSDTIIVNDLQRHGCDRGEHRPRSGRRRGRRCGRYRDRQRHNGDETVAAAGDANGVSVRGLAARVNITGAEAANDLLSVNLLDGDDVLDASGLAVARSNSRRMAVPAPTC